MAGKNISSTSNYKIQRDGSSKTRNLTTIKIAEVMDTTDMARLGRMKVHMIGSDTPKTDSSTWKSIIWTSPFAGATNPFPWMSEIMDLRKEKNFFETRVIEYQTGGALNFDE